MTVMLARRPAISHASEGSFTLRPSEPEVLRSFSPIAFFGIGSYGVESAAPSGITPEGPILTAGIFVPGSPGTFKQYQGGFTPSLFIQPRPPHCPMQELWLSYPLVKSGVKDEERLSSYCLMVNALVEVISAVRARLIIRRCIVW